MKLYVFNPEHDIALAHNDKYFTAPRAGRLLREDCGWLPVLWAASGDFVLVNDVEEAEKAVSRLPHWCSSTAAGITFLTLKGLKKLPDDVDVTPWGWDSALCFQLQKNGISSSSLPTIDNLKVIRELSNRQFAAGMLRKLLTYLDNTNICGVQFVGEANYVTATSSLTDKVSVRHYSVVKEPWSSSGRGVRRLQAPLDAPTLNWIDNIIHRQGGIMIEPYYDKVCDFGMEFYSDDRGISYRGLSVFSTEKGFYTGNVISSEAKKLAALSKLVPHEALQSLREGIVKILCPELKDKYNGPFGVDMMVVRAKNNAQQIRVHPMVEINLRRTMGHVAIDLAERNKDAYATMSIVFKGGHYRLVLENNANAVKSSF